MKMHLLQTSSWAKVIRLSQRPSTADFYNQCHQLHWLHMHAHIVRTAIHTAACLAHSPEYNRFTYTTQSSWADATCRLGSFADLLGVQVHNTVTRCPWPADQHRGKKQNHKQVFIHEVAVVSVAETLWDVHLQSGFVGGSVVGQPTTVSQPLHHVEAENRRNIHLLLLDMMLGC